MLYEPKKEPTPIIRWWEVAAIIIIGIPFLWLLIQVFFGSLPLTGRVDTFVFSHLLGA